MTKYNLFLDDFRVPSDAFKYMKDSSYTTLEWLIVRDYREFVEIVEQLYAEDKFPGLVSFDHDLHDDHYEAPFAIEHSKEQTGLDCAKWLVSFCMEKKLELPNYKIHSMNPGGKENIQSYLESYLKVQHQL